MIETKKSTFHFLIGKTNSLFWRNKCIYAPIFDLNDLLGQFGQFTFSIIRKEDDGKLCFETKVTMHNAIDLRFRIMCVFLYKPSGENKPKETYCMARVVDVKKIDDTYNKVFLEIIPSNKKNVDVLERLASEDTSLLMMMMYKLLIPKVFGKVDVKHHEDTDGICPIVHVNQESKALISSLSQNRSNHFLVFQARRNGFRNAIFTPGSFSFDPKTNELFFPPYDSNAPGGINKYFFYTQDFKNLTAFIYEGRLYED